MILRDRLPSRRGLMLAALGAVLMFTAYPPASFVLPSFICLLPFLWGIEELSSLPDARRPIAVFGYWYGVVANGAVLYWMVVALWHFTPLSALGYASSLLLALGPLWSLLAWATWRAWKGAGIPLWVCFPLFWTTLEWILAHLGDLAFPWLGLGTSLGRIPTLVQWADLAGARGVTLWLAWVNVMLFAVLRLRAWRPAVLVGATLVVALVHGSWRERSLVVRPALKVAMLQPNVGFDEKRDNRRDIRLLTQLLDMTRRAAADTSVGLVAWPEAAVPVFFVNHPHYADSISRLAREVSRHLLVGGLNAVQTEDGGWDTYNAAFFVDTGGRARQPIYAKRYLVPIVERVPFLNPDWFGNLQWFGGFERGDSMPVYRVGQAGFGVVICYESAFENLARRYRRDGADFLLNITNDAWFGRTAAPYQHASHLVMRAIETRMGVARAANSGISQFVDPLGRPYQSTELDTEAMVAGTVMTTDARTLYVRLGDWVGWLALTGTALCCVLIGLNRRRGETV